jgi:hypothetical protein
VPERTRRLVADLHSAALQGRAIRILIQVPIPAVAVVESPAAKRLPSHLRFWAFSRCSAAAARGAETSNSRVRASHLAPNPCVFH